MAEGVIDWDRQPLGEMNDVALARKLGVTSGAVRHARLARGVPRYGPRRVNWSGVAELGKKPDAEIAKRFGVAEATVHHARKRLGIRSYHSRYGKTGIDWDHVLFGKFSDRALAKKLGVSSSTVSSQRRKRGIPKKCREGRAATVLLEETDLKLLRQILTVARAGGDVSVLVRHPAFASICVAVENACEGDDLVGK